ncbi:Predicted phosphohydrolase, MPP superfamily [Fodinibius roseus]|uniref:Predicted phosphohydrolase, MPP superfamily n=1 Tax=Fodinibius roseus TaxID=1194090 RepID=A0A1M4W9H5_9BACT|nr:metallophosphoesterase [Fodinibius roseus]SHE77857.1 Predicted phosphohydrolase, MPP superfamily [Fodinibius roseus]
MPWLLRMTLLVSLLMAPAVIYLVWRLYVSAKQLLDESTWSKKILPAVVCSFYLLPVIGVIDFYLSGDIDLLKYPKPLTYWFWFGLVFVFQLATWILLADLAKGITRFFSWDPRRVDRIHARLLLLLFVVVFSYTGWKVYRDTSRVVVENIPLPVEDLPEPLHGFKVAHISDIQGDEYTGREEISGYISKLNEQNPDLVIFTGDLISYGTDFIGMSARAFGKAEARHGIYAVVGDHDYWAGTGEVKRALNESGIFLLQDKNIRIPVDSSSFAVLTGVTEVYSRRSNPDTVDSLSRRAPEAALKIFASHQVNDYLIESAMKHHYDMMLAGHTHGGQIRVPFMGMDFSASERETKYVSGLYWEGALPIHVNNGLGFTLGPVRYNAPPTVTVIELQPK